MPAGVSLYVAATLPMTEQRKGKGNVSDNMSLLTGFKISLDEVGLLEQASQAAFVGGNIPAGWNVVTPAQLGLGSQYSDGIYFTDPTSRASAIVLQQGSNYVVAFRGTDDPIDTLYYPELFTGAYIHHYDPLLNRLIAAAPPGAGFAFTGASLGGGATNLMADIAGSQFSGRFAAATFVGFASPIIKTAAGILNIGFENDPVYKAINGYADFPSSLDNLVLATSKYMAGNYDGLHPIDAYAHSAALGFVALGRVAQSVFYDFMTPDSVLIFDANAGLVQDVTPGRENTGAFYLGENVADSIAGRNGNDFFEGLGGNDTIDGGLGVDTAGYTGLRSQYQITALPNGSLNVTDLRSGSPDGTDTLSNVELLQFADRTVASNDLTTARAERFFDSATGDHFYTLSTAEANQIRATLPTYHDEGAPWGTPDKGTGTLDVFRFFDAATGAHFLTTSTAERDNVIASLPSYHFEGVAFEAYSAPGDGTLTLERFFNTQTHLHHYAASAAEIASIQGGGAGPGWVDEGAGFIVHT
jgi:Repeat of unknown function (DUF5648)/RTX calcium-binding nonapeptide repeat (4 copies)